MKNNEILRFGFILFAITAVSTALVSFVFTITDPIIAQQKIEKDNAARTSILQGAKEFEKVEGEYAPEIIEVYAGKDASGDIVGYTIKTATNGYGGEVEVTTGISAKDDVLTGISIGSMSETPGLGAKAVNESFYGQYAGKALTELKVEKNSVTGDDGILAISGATITSTAVTRGVNAAINLYNNELK